MGGLCRSTITWVETPACLNVMSQGVNSFVCYRLKVSQSSSYPLRINETPAHMSTKLTQQAECMQCWAHPSVMQMTNFTSYVSTSLGVTKSSSITSCSMSIRTCNLGCTEHISMVTPATEATPLTHF